MKVKARVGLGVGIVLAIAFVLFARNVVTMAEDYVLKGQHTVGLVIVILLACASAFEAYRFLNFFFTERRKHSEAAVNTTAQSRSGVFVATAAIILGGAPFIAKAFLRNTVPPVWTTEDIREMRGATDTTEFLETQRDVALKQAISLATQSDASAPRESSKQRARYRDAVMNLNLLDLKLAEVLKAMIAETALPLGQVIEHEHARRLMLHRAQLFDRAVMAFFTVAMLAFMYFVRGSQTVPRWAQQVSWMAAGAILAGWFPL